MLSYIPYKNIMDNKRKYNIWLLHDVYDNTFADIAERCGISVSTVRGDYEKILFIKMKYYIDYLSFINHCQNTEYYRQICGSAYECYRNIKYVVAFFEKEYTDHLSEYRNGEPGMPKRLLQDLPPLRTKFSARTVSSVIRLREINGMTYEAIGKRLHMTKEKAEKLYNYYYHNLYLQLSEKLMEITGDTDLRRKYRDTFQVRSGKLKYDCLVNDFSELLKNETVNSENTKTDKNADKYIS